MSSSPFDPFIGKTIAGRYRVDSRLGEGGIGAVYVAQHLALGRRVALKVLHERFAGTLDARVRFEREARALSALSHPNIVSVLDFGDEAGSLYLVMELVDGETLADRIRRGRMERRVALELVRQILRALAYAHGVGIVHRDLKPANVLVRTLPDGSEHVTVLDFGLAKFVDVSDPAHTRQGVILGTPAYMAPEQTTGDPAGPASDVYSATLILFELLTGERAFTGREAGELIKAHLIAPIPRLADSRVDVPFSAELEAMVKKGLAKRAADRYPDAKAMLDAFEHLPEADERPSRRLAADAAPTVDLRAPAKQPDAAPAAPPSRGKIALGIGAALIGVAGLGAVGFLVYTFSDASAVIPDDPMGGADASVEMVSDVDAAAALALDAGTDAGLDAGSDAAVDLGIDAGIAADAGLAIAILPPTGPRVPARDPFATEPPQDLRSLYEAITRGDQPSREALQTLYQYAAAHRGDPRAHLLLGRTYTDRGWPDDALQAYREANFRDPSSRGDPRMLQDLVTLASQERSHRAAAGYISGYYGGEARAYVATRLAETTDPVARALLERLRAALETVP